MRRSGVIGVVVALLVLAVCSNPAAEDPARAAASATTGGTDRPPAEQPSSESRTPFQVELDATQPRWNPREVDELAAAPPGTVPGLPSAIDPPSSSTPLAAAPIQSAILGVRQGSTVQLLSTTGEWRSVPLSGRHPSFSLSPLGTGLLVRRGIGEASVVVHDVATGAAREIGPPPRLDRFDSVAWQWRDEQTLLLEDRSGGWLVDARTGEVARVPYPVLAIGYRAIDADGVLVESAGWGHSRVLLDWEGGKVPRRVSMRTTGRLSHLVVDRDTIVGTSYDGHSFAVIVADRADLSPRAVMPVLDYEGNYSPGALRPVALRDDGTVVLRVSVFGRGVDGFRIVAWDPDDGDLSVVATADTPVQQQVELAEGLLRRTGP